MRTHDEEPLRVAVPPKSERSHEDGGATLAQRAIEQGRPDSLTPSAVMHLQRAAGNAGVGALMGHDEERSPVHDVVGSGGGQPLDAGVRATMEQAFGQDFGDVRVHTGGQAAESAKSVQASAYTVGSDIVFDHGHYDPSSAAGQRTLAHELTHVAQQRSGPVDGTPAGGGVQVSDPSDRFEREAERTADTVMAGGGQPPVLEGGAAVQGTFVQREASEEEEMPEEEELASQRMVQREAAPEEEEELAT